jgi:hypothetical protein
MQRLIPKQDSFDPKAFVSKMTTYDNNRCITQYKVEMLAVSIIAVLAMTAFAITVPFALTFFTPLIGFPFLLDVFLCNREKNHLQAENKKLFPTNL